MSRFFSKRHSALVPYVPGEQPQDRKFIKLNTNESPYPPAPLAQKLARQAVGDLALYSDPECTALRRTAAEYFGLKPEEILFVNGSDEALFFVFTAFCDEQHPAVFPDVTYGFYPVYASLCHVPYREAALREDYSVRTEDYLEKGEQVFLANPNAQTGLFLPLNELRRILDADPDRLVTVDEAYVDFGGDSAVSLIREYANLLVIRTFSKSRNLAGARLGFVMGQEELIRDLNTVKYSVNPYNVNRVSQAAGIGALLEEEYFRSCCEKICRTREQTRCELRALGFDVTDSKANFLLAGHPKLPGRELYERLREAGILVRHFSAPRLADRVRITVGSQEEMDGLIRVLKSFPELEGKD